MKRLLLFISVCVITLTTYIVVNTFNTSTSSEITSVNMSLYRDDSNKPQPELVNVLYSSEELKKIENWLDSGDPAGMPLVHQIQQIWTLQLAYESEGKVIETDYYMVVNDMNGNIYLKRFDMTSAYSLDKYDHSIDSFILKWLGPKGWSKVSLFPV
ncbi:hypothetical protein ACP8HI_05080 [Paenibacillus sp. FA6]|uniref:hypothetical protein n=1 Tax=Paenibacillus sp. FA6 TaxID=3413029 RepID=UPI003F6583BB